MQHIITMIVVVEKNTFFVEFMTCFSSQMNIFARRMAFMKKKQKESVASYNDKLHEC